MTNLTKILILLNIALWLSSPTAQSQEGGLYCNESFHFCIHYPSSFLPYESPLSDNTGIELKTEDGRGTVTIAGYWERTGMEPRQIFRSRFEILKTGKQPDDISSVISSLFGEDFFEAFFLVGRNYYYHKSFLFDGYYVLLEIKTPVNRPDLMMLLRKQIELDFQLELPKMEIGLLKHPSGM